MKLHHVGIVVNNLAEAQRAWSHLGYKPRSTEVFDPIQKVALLLLDGDGDTVELIAAAAPDSPVASAAKKGGGLHHLCYEVHSLDTAVKKAVESGAICVCPPVHAVLFNRRVAFLYFRELGLIEFLDRAPNL